MFSLLLLPASSAWHLEIKLSCYIYFCLGKNTGDGEISCVWWCYRAVLEHGLANSSRAPCAAGKHAQAADVAAERH